MIGPKAALDRRQLLALGAAAMVCLATEDTVAADADPIRFALTPVLLTSDLDLIALLKSYLEAATGSEVQLVTRRTYQEISTLLLSGQVDAAWICGYPFVAARPQLALVAVPIWRGGPRYQAYLIADASRSAEGIDSLAGDIHAFSDPDSNSGYLVTAAELARRGTTPERFFRQTIFTYGHNNVVRAVASGLAQSGSVDGYVYEVMREVEPELIAATKVVRASDWFGFPPIACRAAASASPKTAKLRAAFLGMGGDPVGRQALAALRLDGFAEEPESLFDTIAANVNLVRGLG